MTTMNVNVQIQTSLALSLSHDVDLEQSLILSVIPQVWFGT